MSARMLNGRLYRAAFVPLLISLAVAALSLTPRPTGLTTTLAPDAFEGPRALGELRELAARYPHRRPGSAGDEALAAHIAHALSSLGAAGAGGFSVRSEHFYGETIDGRRALTNVIAERPGSTSASAVVILAHRDSASASAPAELSGTAALLELARVFAARATKRTIVLVSSSSGSGGDAGAAHFAAGVHEPIDAAIVLGDLAGRDSRKPFVVPYSDGVGAAPLRLQRTLADAIARETGAQAGAPSTLGQLAHLAFPLATGEQGVLLSHGIDAVMLQASGERGPSAGEPLSGERLQSFGRAALDAVDALDSARDVPPGSQAGMLLSRKTVPTWAVRLLAAMLLLGPILLAVDGLARARRRRLPLGRASVWTFACALPFLLCALYARALGALGLLAAPLVPAPPAAMPLDAGAGTVVASVALMFVLAWLLWGAFIRRIHWGTPADREVAPVAVMLLLALTGVVVWAANPFASLLLMPALHLWLVFGEPRLRPRRGIALALLALGLAPALALLAFYAHQLGVGPAGIPWMGVLLLAGGHVGLGAALLWSVALGCAAAAGIMAISAPRAPGRDIDAGVPITIRGPLSYAGPGSLGGTESALRR